MEILDRVLGGLEFVLVPLSIAWLLLAVRRPNLQRARRASALALVLALTVAQPFGVIASRTGPLPPPGAVATSTGGVHVARLFGVLPVAPFVLTHRDEPLAGLGENSTTATLRARSWLWAPVLTNATNVVGICSTSISDPCWEPEGNDDRARYDDTLRLARSGGDHWVTFANPSSISDPNDVVPDTIGAWRLRSGVASPAGLVYWLLAGGLVLVVRRRTQEVPSAVTGTATASSPS